MKPEHEDREQPEVMEDPGEPCAKCGKPCHNVDELDPYTGYCEECHAETWPEARS